MATRIKRRARRSREQWQQLLDEQRRGTLSEVVFCQSKGISCASFRSWRRRLATPDKPDHWLELSELAAAAPRQSWDIELDLGNGICLRLRRGGC